MTRISVAIAALLIAAPAAFAQTTTTPPATSPPAAAPSTAPGAMKFYSSTLGQMRASKLIGLNVKNNANETIGEINELILDKDGKVAAVVIGVGGFLGIGQHEVAIDYKSLNVKYDPNAMTDAGATTVGLTIGSERGVTAVDVDAVRDAWVAALNSLDWEGIGESRLQP